MPDGSRANVAISPAAPYGPTITIRKFKSMPYNVIDLIEFGSLSSELAAFLWVAVEGFGISPCDLLISGGSGSGKTTLLNALAMFIPIHERIVTVEDTLELNFSFMKNWIPLEASSYFFEKDSAIDMHLLLKNSLRMRPDRVIVGEVRGEEAETFLVAMDIGLDGSMCTIHANNARETTVRLLEEPMSVPIRMIPLIDLIVVANRIYDRRKGTIRRVVQVAEISGVEKDVVQMGDIYKWDIRDDQIKRTEFPIMVKEKIARKCGITKKALNTEIYIREKILLYMLKNNIRANNLQKYITIIPGDAKLLPKKTKDKFDIILSNPPQSAGKKLCFEIIEKAPLFLKLRGSLQLVARHKKGGKDLSKKMQEIFGNVETLGRKSGYHIYYSEKQ